MELRRYLKENGITNHQFAVLVDASPDAVRKWRYGERVPRPEHLVRIREATGGAVTPNDFLPASSEAA